LYREGVQAATFSPRVAVKCKVLWEEIPLVYQVGERLEGGEAAGGRKLDLHDRAQAVVLACESGLVQQSATASA
jgi:hypothetical protein